ncbi:MAG: hypothetical protein J6I73_09480 [Treponema sp.]|nr:hypothetical protein [Treponema sp.]
MPLLQVRNCPTLLYETIARVAASENRSIAQQTLALLQQSFDGSVDAKKAKRIHALEETKTLALVLPKNAPSPESLVSEDRSR